MGYSSFRTDVCHCKQGSWYMSSVGREDSTVSVLSVELNGKKGNKRVDKIRLQSECQCLQRREGEATVFVLEGRGRGGSLAPGGGEGGSAPKQASEGGRTAQRRAMASQ